MYALTPAFLILAIRTIDTLLITKGLKPNPYLHKVLPKRTTAQVLDENGNFSGAGQEKVTVLLLGAKTNHPMGIFAPDFSKVGEYFKDMTEQLEDSNSQDNGCMIRLICQVVNTKQANQTVHSSRSNKIHQQRRERRHANAHDFVLALPRACPCLRAQSTTRESLALVG